jgi:hypothetical protein
MVKLAASLAGAALALISWLLLLPWDLSEVDADGRVLDQGGDDFGGMIAVVAGIVVTASVGILLARRARWASAWVAMGGMAVWATLFAWRAGTSETSGANMFMIPLLFVVIPLTVAAPLALHRITKHLDG